MRYKTLLNQFKNKGIDYLKSYIEILNYEIPYTPDKKQLKSYLYKLKRILKYYAIIDKGQRLKARRLKDYTTK